MLMSDYAALDAQKLTLSYGDRVTVVNASLRLRHGSVTALVGPNGSGKSTLLRALARLHRVESGAITLDGAPLETLSARTLAQRLTLLAQHRPTPAGVTVREAVHYGRHPHRYGLFGRDAEGAEHVRQALLMTGLDDLADEYVDELSGGQIQRVWLASCLAQQATTLLLDEPTNHLDLRHQVELLRLIRRLADDHDVAVGVVLHDLNQAAAVADRLVLLHEGRIAAQGAPHEVLTQTILSQCYEIPVAVTRDGPRISIDALRSLDAPLPDVASAHAQQTRPRATPPTSPMSPTAKATTMTESDMTV